MHKQWQIKKFYEYDRSFSPDCKPDAPEVSCDIRIWERNSDMLVSGGQLLQYSHDDIDRWSYSTPRRLVVHDGRFPLDVKDADEIVDVWETVDDKATIQSLLHIPTNYQQPLSKHLGGLGFTGLNAKLIITKALEHAENGVDIVACALLPISGRLVGADALKIEYIQQTMSFDREPDAGTALVYAKQMQQVAEEYNLRPTPYTSVLDIVAQAASAQAFGQIATLREGMMNMLADRVSVRLSPKQLAALGEDVLPEGLLPE